ncbi:hypothetical protein [Aestuariivivens marinum]|uniref:hypothetical protein n=1 Tax=Aestuariivivens marinum TaxID=2913555 RepID=UPI001F56DF21|nr:hypothetical protein [Aestuariivivens marinum]
MKSKILNKVLFIVVIGMVMAFTTNDAMFKSTSVIVTSESSLVVRGTTNVNTFTCGFDVLKLKNPVQVLYKKVGARLVFDKTALVLDNDCFDCGGIVINSDFRKILKSKMYPQITLFLNDINDLEEQTDDVLASIDIEIAGVSKNHKVPIKFKKGRGMLITGVLPISMSDYDLKPPKKFFGLITVHDIIKIYFQLAVKES